MRSHRIDHITTACVRYTLTMTTLEASYNSAAQYLNQTASKTQSTTNKQYNRKHDEYTQQTKKSQNEKMVFQKKTQRSIDKHTFKNFVGYIKFI